MNTEKTICKACTSGLGMNEFGRCLNCSRSEVENSEYLLECECGAEVKTEGASCGQCAWLLDK